VGEVAGTHSVVHSKRAVAVAHSLQREGHGSSGGHSIFQGKTVSRQLFCAPTVIASSATHQASIWSIILSFLVSR